MNSVLQRVYEIGIIPVIAFNSVDEALPLCKALMAGGLPAAEVTFRTACWQAWWGWAMWRRTTRMATTG